MTDILTKLLVIKEHIKNIYARYNVFIEKGGKFLLSLVAFLLIGSKIGYFELLSSPFISLGLSILCAFLPLNLIMIFASFVMLLNILVLSPEMGIVTLVLLLVMYIFYFRFTPKEALIVMLTPIAFAMKIPYVIPLAMGLLGTPLSAISVGFGVIVYYLIHFISIFYPSGNTESGNIVSKITFFTENILQNKEMLLTLVAFVLVVITVYGIKRLSVDYSWMIAAAAGSVLNIAVMLMGDFILDISSSYLIIFLGTIVSLLIVLVLQFFVFTVDYSRTERVQYEDDEYYYYVKAVPKMSMTVQNKQIKRINPRKPRGFGRKQEEPNDAIEELEFEEDE